MNERLHQLISDKLWAVYIPSNLRALPRDTPFNEHTADNIQSHYEDLEALADIVEMLNSYRSGLDDDEIQALPMADLIEQLEADELYIGEGLVVWTEIGRI